MRYVSLARQCAYNLPPGVPILYHTIPTFDGLAEIFLGSLKVYTISLKAMFYGLYTSDLSFVIFFEKLKRKFRLNAPVYTFRLVATYTNHVDFPPREIVGRLWI